MIKEEIKRLEQEKNKEEIKQKHHEQRELYRNQLLNLLRISGYNTDKIYSPMQLLEALESVGYIKVERKTITTKKGKVKNLPFPLKFTIQEYNFCMDIDVISTKACFTINDQNQWLDIWYKRLYECLKGNKITTDLMEW